MKPAVSSSVFGHFWGCGQKCPAPEGAELSLSVTWRKNERAVEDAGSYKGLGESAPVSGGASMRAARDAGPYGSESGAVSKFENISKRTDTSTSRAGATRGGITNNIKNHEASQKPPLRSNGAAHYRAERGSGSDKRSVSDSLYDDVQHLGFRGVRGDRFLTYPNRAGSLETCGFKQRFWPLLGLRPKVTRARGRGTLPVGDMEEKRTGRRGRRPLQRVRRKCAGIWRCVDAGCRGRRPLRERERGRQQI